MQEHIERKITLGAIVSKEFLETISDTYKKEYIVSKVASDIISWCVRFYTEHDSAPDSDIEDYLYERKATLEAEELEDLISIMDSLNADYSAEDINIEYLIDKTIKYFSTRDIELLATKLKASISSGKEENARDLLLKYNPVERQKIDGVDPFNSDVFEKALTNKTERLFTVDGELGDIINPELYREGFIIFLGPRKANKSYVLMDLAIKAAEQGNKVAIFQTGDMSEDKFFKRMAVYFTKRHYDEKYCKDGWKSVIDCKHNADNSCTEQYRTNNIGLFDGDYSDEREDVIEAHKQTPTYERCISCMLKNGCRNKFEGCTTFVKTKQRETLNAEHIAEFKKDNKQLIDKMMVATYPMKTFSPKMMKGKLESWAKYKDFIPDVIVVDYAGIMAPDVKGDERREADSVYSGLRTVSQEYRACLITAAQADAESFNKELLNSSNFSVDNRQQAHCTSYFGINSTQKDKDLNRVRINCMLSRDEDTPGTVVCCTQNLNIARPLQESYRIIKKSEE